MQMATVLNNLYPGDSIFKNILGDSYLAKGNYSKAQECYNAAVYKDVKNTGIRWKCGDSSCIKRSWCMSCNDVRGSDGGWCSHDHPIQIPSGKVGVMRALWESRTREASLDRREIR